MQRLTTLGAALLLVLALAPPGAAQRAAAPLVLRPGDAVRLAVRAEPTLAGDFPVLESGAALLPEIGLIAVAGRPFAEVEREVFAAYAEILVDPEVVVVPVLRIAVLGEVREPGLVPVDPTLTLGEVLASAGGLTPAANPRDVALVRDGATVRLRVDAEVAALGERFRSGDQIVVGEQGWVRSNLPIVVGAGASALAAAITGLLLR